MSGQGAAIRQKSDCVGLLQIGYFQAAGDSALSEEKERNSENSIRQKQKGSLEPIGFGVPDHGRRYQYC
ncbi:MAG TPA: hypothetical protein VM166_10480, partial [Gemmatimonadaceae bacterium]|nr:hypothetical protein [Gemmatimonadaceae bacterium]